MQVLRGDGSGFDQGRQARELIVVAIFNRTRIPTPELFGGKAATTYPREQDVEPVLPSLWGRGKCCL